MAQAEQLIVEGDEYEFTDARVRRGLDGTVELIQYLRGTHFEVPDQLGLELAKPALAARLRQMGHVFIRMPRYENADAPDPIGRLAAHG